MTTLLMVLAIGLVAVIFALAGALVFGGPGTPSVMSSMSDPFRSVDFSDLPKPDHFSGQDGVSLAYRHYPPNSGEPAGSVVLIHGSSADGISMHPLAKAFAAAGFAVYTLDVRGHGGSGEKGRIAFVGQLEQDLEAFVQAVAPVSPSTLIGFSAGGGFALRFAGGRNQALFHSYLLLSPFLGQDAPSYRPSGGGWVSVGLWRVAALSFLNKVGVHWFDKLPVTRFALPDDAKKLLTPEYSLALTANFRPRFNVTANIRAVRQPVAVLVGTDDEVFFADRVKDVIRAAGRDWPVSLLPGVGHVSLTLDAGAAAAAVHTVQVLQEEGAPGTEDPV